MLINHSNSCFIFLAEIIQLYLSLETTLLILGLIIIILIVFTVIIMSKEDYLGKIMPKNSSSFWKERNKFLHEKINQSRKQLKIITEQYQKKKNPRIKKEKKHKTIDNQIKELSVKLQQIQEEEKTIITRELYEELGQQLMAIKQDLSLIKSRYSKDNAELNKKIEFLINKSNQDSIKNIE